LLRQGVETGIDTHGCFRGLATRQLTEASQGLIS
jgi:hypothetical protein